MIQFNLLPDIKLEYVKARRAKRLTLLVSTLSSAGILVITGLLFSYVQFGQKAHIDDLTKDIDSELSSLKKTEDLDKILTIQNQLNSLPALHEGKPAISRLFGFIQQLTPVDVTISALDVKVPSTTISIVGKAKDLAAATTMADTLKFAEYSTDYVSGVKVFSGVNTTLSRGESGEASYNITANFDPVIFKNTENVKLIIPSTVTTRSVLEKPSAIFESSEQETGGAND